MPKGRSLCWADVAIDTGTHAYKFARKWRLLRISFTGDEALRAWDRSSVVIRLAKISSRT